MKQMQASNVLRRGDRQDHARQRDAALQLRPVLGARRQENCTVGALRAQAEGWDVSIVARGIKASGTGAIDLLKFAKADRSSPDPTGDWWRRRGTRPPSLKRPQRPFLVGVDDDRVARFAADDERDDAVVAGRRARHHAVAAIDR